MAAHLDDKHVKRMAGATTLGGGMLFQPFPCQLQCVVVDDATGSDKAIHPHSVFTTPSWKKPLCSIDLMQQGQFLTYFIRKDTTHFLKRTLAALDEPFVECFVIVAFYEFLENCSLLLGDC